MNLDINIHKIKCINDFKISLPIDKGLYAITGRNGSGKSTIVTCASSVFYNFPMNKYFGKTDYDSYIKFELENSKRKWSWKNGKWKRRDEGESMDIKGFYEGSLIFGNRFRDMNFDNLDNLDKIDQSKFKEADSFICENLGRILQGDKNYYEKVWRVSDYTKFKGTIFYYEKNGKKISQFHMSTGENLLINILNSLNLRNKDKQSLSKPRLIFLDEIELALHPSSLKELLFFLEEMSTQHNYAIYFSTHSIELIGGIKPSNIFYIEKYPDNKMSVINPCYPAYATRILYDHSGYDKIILVEDDLAKLIVDKVLKDEKLLNGKLVHVLPCGGYTNVIDLANDAISHNLLGRNASISIVLDGDVKDKATSYMKKKNINNNIPLNYLPIESLEKFLKTKLYDNVDELLFRELNDYIFQYKSLTDILCEYKKECREINDSNGKKLFSLIEKELKERKKDRMILVDYIVQYLFINNNDSLGKIKSFLKQQLL